MEEKEHGGTRPPFPFCQPPPKKKGACRIWGKRGGLLEGKPRRAHRHAHREKKGLGALLGRKVGLRPLPGFPFRPPSPFTAPQRRKRGERTKIKETPLPPCKEGLCGLQSEERGPIQSARALGGKGGSFSGCFSRASGRAMVQKRHWSPCAMSY